MNKIWAATNKLSAIRHVISTVKLIWGIVIAVIALAAYVLIHQIVIWLYKAGIGV